MSLLDLFPAQAGPSGPALIQTPSTPGERFSAEMEAATAPDRWFNITGSRRDGWQSVIDQLQTATGKTFLNPYMPNTSEEVMRLGNDLAIQSERKQRIRDARNALLQDAGIGDAIPDPDMIDRQIGEAGDAVRKRAGSLVGTGNGLAGFAGGMLAPTPENILGLLVPPSRLVLGATTTARGFFAGLVREAGYQAAVNAGLTAGTEGLDILARQETGTAPTGSEVLSNIGMSAAFGAVLGGGFHALTAGPKALWERWNRLPEEVRAKAPLEVRDAMTTLQQEAIYVDANRLGLPWALHERYQGRALDAVMRGTAVKLEELRPVDTPMTALGMILRETPGQIRAEGLPQIVARTAALPDSELEPIVRQLKPQAFTQLDAVDTKLRALDDRVAAIRAEAGQIGAPDVIDMDTAAILHDIDEQLGQKNLRRAVRDELEHQKRQWMETLDAHGGLTRELEQMRAAFFPEHGPALKEIAAEREKLMRERGFAQQEAQREIDFLRGKFGQMEIAQPADVPKALGFKEPADFANALQAAEFDRQARIIRDVATEVRAPAPAPTTTALPASPELEAAATAVLESKGGAIAEFRRVVKREMDALDAEIKDAMSALKCAGAASA